MNRVDIVGRRLVRPRTAGDYRHPIEHAHIPQPHGDIAMVDARGIESAAENDLSHVIISPD
jgi:hypothetical protein